MKRHSWSQAEIMLLEALAQTLPVPALVKSYNRKANRSGLTQRSEEAITIKLKRLGLSRKCHYDHFTMDGLARELNISPSRVWRWVHRDGLRTKSNGYPKAIALQDFRQFARARPERLYGIRPELLRWLEIDPTPIPAAYSAQGVQQPVQRLDTMQVYPSIQQAAKAHYVCGAAIYKALRHNRPCAGIKWRRVDHA